MPKPSTIRRHYHINFPVFHVLQKLRRATPSYLESVQTDMNASMRAILVDWLVEVCQEYRLVSDTLFLAVSYLDRYLSLVPVSRSRLQLVGVTCLLLAAKYEEIYAPQVGWLSGVCFPCLLDCVRLFHWQIALLPRNEGEAHTIQCNHTMKRNAIRVHSALSLPTALHSACTLSAVRCMH